MPTRPRIPPPPTVPQPGQSSGPATDAQNTPVIDPTENVKALSEAASKRQDDLRDAANELMEAKIRHLQEVMQLRADYSRELAQMESGRLNAIRAVDVQAVNTASDRAAAATSALAANAAANADNIRSALNSTATTIAAQLANTVSTITERLAALEKTSYEGAGKQKYADPMMTDMMNEMKSMLARVAQGEGKSQGGQAMWGYVAAGFGFFLTLIGIGSALFAMVKP